MLAQKSDQKKIPFATENRLPAMHLGFFRTASSYGNGPLLFPCSETPVCAASGLVSTPHGEYDEDVLSRLWEVVFPSTNEKAVITIDGPHRPAVAILNGMNGSPLSHYMYLTVEDDERRSKGKRRGEGYPSMALSDVRKVLLIGRLDRFRTEEKFKDLTWGIFLTEQGVPHLCFESIYEGMSLYIPLCYLAPKFFGLDPWKADNGLVNDDERLYFDHILLPTFLTSVENQGLCRIVTMTIRELNDL